MKPGPSPRLPISSPFKITAYTSTKQNFLTFSVSLMFLGIGKKKLVKKSISLSIKSHFLLSPFLFHLKNKTDLIDTIKSFALSPSHPLIDWFRLLGCASWSLNSFPLGRFSLQSSWDKTISKPLCHTHVFVSSECQDNLRWLASTLESWSGHSSSHPSFRKTCMPILFSLLIPALPALVFGSRQLSVPGLMVYPPLFKGFTALKPLRSFSLLLFPYISIYNVPSSILILFCVFKCSLNKIHCCLFVP